MTKRSWLPEIWAITGFATLAASLFFTGERGDFLYVVSLLCWIKADTTGLRREIGGPSA